MSVVEVLGVVSGAASVWLAVRQHVWTFPVGLANNVLFIALFVPAGLYADAWLQVVFVVIGVHGWWSWLRGGPGHSVLVVRRDPRWGWPLAVVSTAGLTGVVWLLLTRHTDSTVPQWDALTTALSLVAQAMLNRKWVGNWVVWAVADVVYVALYAAKGLWLTSLLYAGFLVLCLVGLRQWRAALREQEAGLAGGLPLPVGGLTDAPVRARTTP